MRAASIVLACILAVAVAHEGHDHGSAEGHGDHVRHLNQATFDEALESGKRWGRGTNTTPTPAARSPSCLRGLRVCVLQHVRQVLRALVRPLQAAGAHVGRARAHV